jgi:hypothetical protein
VQEVDVISLSWSLGGGHSPVIEAAIQKAISNGIIVLAATHNEGENEEIEFPASLPNVFCIGAADGNGGIPSVNPLQGKSEKFAALGIAVEGAGPSPRPIENHQTFYQKDGSSVATPIAAGIAANLLEYINRFTTPEPTEINGYIRSLFLHMTADRSRSYYYLCPWKLLDGSNIMEPEWRWTEFEEKMKNPPASHWVPGPGLQEYSGRTLFCPLLTASIMPYGSYSFKYQTAKRVYPTIESKH